MKKLLLSGVFILAFALYAGYQYFHPSSVSVANNTGQSNVAITESNATSVPNTNTTVPTGSTPTATTTPKPIPAPAPSPSGLKDGTYTGRTEDAYYGNVQVKAIVSGGKITDVVFLQYPNDRRQSVEINSIATPMLRSEAIASQSAQVDIVSGATQTSEAFIRSLQSALDQA